MAIKNLYKFFIFKVLMYDRVIVYWLRILLLQRTGVGLLVPLLAYWSLLIVTLYSEDLMLTSDAVHPQALNSQSTLVVIQMQT